MKNYDHLIGTTVTGYQKKSGEAYDVVIGAGHVDILAALTAPKARYTNEDVVLMLGVNQARLMELRDAGLVVQDGRKPVASGNLANAFVLSEAGGTFLSRKPVAA